MNQSILTSIKKLIGIDEDYTAYDTDVIIHINTVFSSLHQIGVGPKKPFHIENAESTWEEFTGDRLDIESVKTYVYLKVKLVFDPPTTSFVIQSIENQLKELEWRLYVAMDTPTPTGEEE